MEENSIEEDIKLLEEFSNENVLYGSTVGMTLEKYKDLQLSTEHILSDYKRVLQENEYMHNELDKQQTKINKYAKENEELKNENDELNKELNEENKRCMMLAVEKQDYLEKHQYHLKQNESLTKEFSDYIPIQKIKDKIEKEIKYHEKNILDIENITILKSKTAKEEAEIEFNKYAIVVLNKVLQELLERKNND